MKHTIATIVKGTATFVSYKEGILTYSISVHDKDDWTRYRFTIDANNKEDVGTGEFKLQEKGIMLMRWLKRCVDDGTVIVKTESYDL